MPIKTNLTDLASARDKFKQTIQLLSHGYYAPELFPDGNITVYPWDSKLDDWLIARGKSGDRDTMIYQVIKKVADLKGFDLTKMPIGDAITILLVSRAMQTDYLVRYSALCPVCRRREDATVNVPKDLQRTGEKKTGYPGYDEVTLEKCQDVVRTRPLTVGDELAIIQRDSELRKRITDRTARVFSSIVSVNEGTPDDADEVERWYDALPPSDATALREHINRSEPRLDTRVPHVCDDCQTQFHYTLDITTDFFR